MEDSTGVSHYNGCKIFICSARPVKYMEDMGRSEFNRGAGNGIFACLSPDCQKCRRDPDFFAQHRAFIASFLFSIFVFPLE